MHPYDIDWNKYWRQMRVDRPGVKDDPGFWDKRAPDFTRNVDSSGYIKQFIAIMQWRINAGWYMT